MLPACCFCWPCWPTGRPLMTLCSPSWVPAAELEAALADCDLLVTGYTPGDFLQANQKICLPGWVGACLNVQAAGARARRAGVARQEPASTAYRTELLQNRMARGRSGGVTTACASRHAIPPPLLLTAQAATRRASTTPCSRVTRWTPSAATLASHVPTLWPSTRRSTQQPSLSTLTSSSPTGARPYRLPPPAAASSCLASGHANGLFVCSPCTRDCARLPRKGMLACCPASSAQQSPLMYLPCYVS